jgi:hypothetical protein
MQRKWPGTEPAFAAEFPRALAAPEAAQFCNELWFGGHSSEPSRCRSTRVEAPFAPRVYLHCSYRDWKKSSRRDRLAARQSCVEPLRAALDDWPVVPQDYGVSPHATAQLRRWQAMT